MDNQKKYEAAAKEYALDLWKKDNTVNVPIAQKHFLAGASFAEKEGWDAAIEKAIESISESADSDGMILRYWPIFKDELEKLKR